MMMIYKSPQFYHPSGNNYITISMEQNPWEANSHLASQIPSLLYCVHKSLPLVPILNKMNSFHNFSLYSL